MRDGCRSAPRHMIFTHTSSRRVLLNKCQEEFEAGDNAMKAVDAREKAAAEKNASGEVRPAQAAS